MRRKAILLVTMTWLILGMVSFAQSRQTAASPQASLNAVAVADSASASQRARQETSSGAATVSGISVKAGPAGETFIDVSTTHPTAYNVLRLPDPARLVVDLEGARTGTRQRAYAASSSVLKGVRVGQFRAGNPSVVRVVADLAGDPTFDVHAQPGGVRIELRSRLSSVAAATPPPESAPAPAKTEEKPVAVAAAVSPPVVPSAQPEAASSDANKGEASTPTGIDVQSTLPAPAGSHEVSASPKPEAAAEAPEAVQAAKAAIAFGRKFRGDLCSASGAGFRRRSGAAQVHGRADFPEPERC